MDRQSAVMIGEGFINNAMANPNYFNSLQDGQLQYYESIMNICIVFEEDYQQRVRWGIHCQNLKEIKQRRLQERQRERQRERQGERQWERQGKRQRQLRKMEVKQTIQTYQRKSLHRVDDIQRALFNNCLFLVIMFFGALGGLVYISQGFWRNYFIGCILVCLTVFLIINYRLFASFCIKQTIYEQD